MNTPALKVAGLGRFARGCHVLGVRGLFLILVGFALPMEAQPSVSSRPKTAPAQLPVAPVSTSWTGFHQRVQPFFSRYCYKCHGAKTAENDFRLDLVHDEPSFNRSGPVLEKAFRQIANHKMPPADEPQPPLAETGEVMAWLKTHLVGDPTEPINPGRVTLRRLNRVEYNNTLRDLLGITSYPADAFPVDDAGYGFDNNGDVLSLAPMLLEKYLNAAGFAIGEARRAGGLAKLAPSSSLPKREAAEAAIRRFASRAYRRPVTENELRRLMALWARADADGRAFEPSLDVALQAVLVSPAFIFRIELEPQPGEPAGIHTLNEYELATRLSYFLWSSLPDDELFAQAEKGTLRANLGTQVRRMLGDPKAAALVENFAGQWLQLRAMQDVAPDADLFPQFDAALRHAMTRETELFFTAIMQEDRSVLEFIDADFTYVNARLAKHYGLSGITGEEFRRVELRDSHRGGLLTQASILTITSYPRRTSPVLRGKWVLENLLDAAPPPPPPSVPVLPEGRSALVIPLRQRLENHRADPRCAACHERMDNIGFALENFDPLGSWRTLDGIRLIDAEGKLPGGEAFDGVAELKQLILKSHGDEFLDCLAGRLLTYALGRGLEPYDQRTIETIRLTLKKNDGRFSALIFAIVRSEPFQKRNGRPKLDAP